ncbi:FxsA family protein [Modestobacter sp. I12A-02628]|uniref:FxsA family protein n=1 Tax=Goekera deserti TaxID=2497753 RepID=A0A7K3WE19_9ACTN|nr:FxsA family protein [Goekera deserti]MPQ99667.1 FxsA family protein [Goekera deserti]NDI46323.1 FxsA family protein [Goekera deserti]NEL54745.1 FxsA family protein [Goekera deserti]
MATPLGSTAVGRPARAGRLRPLLGLYALAEVVVFVLVASQIGVGWTILLSLGTSVLGWVLLARQGSRVLRDLQERARTRRPAADALGNAGLVAAGGGLMVLPGFIGDVLGLLCLLPGTRAIARTLIARVFAARVLSHLPDRAAGPVHVTSTRTGEVFGASGHRAAPSVIEGEVVGGEPGR